MSREKKTVEEKLDVVFNLSDSEYSESEIVPIDNVENNIEIVNPSNTDTDDDFEYARENIRDTIDKASSALDGILHLAKEAEHPRAYEVASGLVKTLVDANKDLLELRKKKKDIEKEEPKNETNVTNNSLFIGSTAELQKLISKRGDDSGE
jgi:dTDP-D-glucose 4,6-dehydratase